ncbi:unnamed protein product [Rhizophagus irregularis]|nr:unnamed protein product [Rhizophagus irregularis]
MLSSSEHWGNNQLPIQFMKELNIQTKSTKNNICIRDDTVFKYYEDTDTLLIYFAKATSGVIRQSREPNDYTLASYDGDDKIVSFEIWEASKLLCCHLFDTSEMIDNKPPLSLYPICYEDRDELEILLIGSKPSFITFKKTEDKDFEVGMNDENKIVTLLFHNVSSRLAKTLPEKEREKLAEEARLRSLEDAKWDRLLLNKQDEYRQFIQHHHANTIPTKMP